MEITLTKLVKCDVKYLKVDAGVRYWEDADINGTDDVSYEEQEKGATPRMPFAVKEGKEYRWQITIDLEQGLILGWPSNVTANIHYKVCDDGTYSLLDDKMNVVIEKDCYVPDLLCIDDDGWGDYIIFSVNEDGLIRNWNNRDIQSLIDKFVETEGFND